MLKSQPKKEYIRMPFEISIRNSIKKLLRFIFVFDGNESEEYLKEYC